MPVFHLEPTLNGLNNAAWAASWHRGSCHVVADDEARARLYANCAFIIPLQSAAGSTDGTMPWLSADLVHVVRMEGTAEFGSVGSVDLGNCVIGDVAEAPTAPAGSEPLAGVDGWQAAAQHTANRVERRKAYATFERIIQSTSNKPCRCRNGTYSVTARRYELRPTLVSASDGHLV